MKTTLLAAALASLASGAAAQDLILELNGTEPSSVLGWDVDFVGDLNGDGVDEVVAGAPTHGSSGLHLGAAFVFDGVTGAAIFQWDGLHDYHMGAAVAGPGDVDGDGVPDILVGATFADNAAGRAWLYSGVDGSVLYSMTGSVAGKFFGSEVVGLGDVDGDGYRDFAVSATGGNNILGEVTVYSGRDGGVHWQKIGSSSLFGYSLDALGDIDGDGLGDVIVGDFGAQDGVHVYSGASGVELFHFASPALVSMGHEVSGVGDVNLDGTPDMLVGVGSNNQAGILPSLRVLSGSDGSLLAERFGTGFFSEFGSVLAGAGDQNGDGVPDILVSQAAAGVDPVKVFLLSGANLEVLLEFSGARGLGKALATGGDLNGFGASEVLIAKPNDGTFPEPGKVFAYSVGCSSDPMSSYCSTSPNSGGAGAVMAFQGSSSVAANDLRLIAFGCPASQFGIFYYGAGEAATPFGDGLRCVSAPITRLHVINTGTGAASWSFDVAGQAPSGSEITAGMRRNFQFWYRDPAAGMSGFNLSDGLRVEFCP